MDIFKMSQQETGKSDKSIKEGLYYCLKCEIIMSSYYLRTYSTNCLRGANFGRCKKCSKKSYCLTAETRLTKGNVCPECDNTLDNHWTKACFEPLKEMSLSEFKNYCLIAMQKHNHKFAISEETVESLYVYLCKKDFVFFPRQNEAGLNYSQVIRLMDEFRKNYVIRKNAFMASG